MLCEAPKGAIWYFHHYAVIVQCIYSIHVYIVKYRRLSALIRFTLHIKSKWLLLLADKRIQFS